MRSVNDTTWSYLMRWDAIRAALQFKAILDKRYPDPAQCLPDIEAYAEARGNLVKSLTTSEDRDLQEFVLGLLTMFCRFELYYEGGVYTREEWKERGEDYGDNADLVVTCEGDVCRCLYYGEHEHAVAEFQGLLDKHKMECEWLYCWAFAIRKSDNA